MKSANSKQPFFSDPEPHLKKFIHYYAFCLKHFSPLMPDWIPFFLNEDVNGLQNAIDSLFNEKSKSYQNPYLQWLFNKRNLPSMEGMIREWKKQTEDLAGEINQFWYS